MTTETEQNIAIGAAIGIASAMASAKISAMSGNADNGMLSNNARVIASTLLGADVPETDEAVAGLIKALGNEQLLSKMTFADVVGAIEQSNEIHSKTIKEAVEAAEQSVSPDIVSLNHIDAQTDELIAVTGRWVEMDYEHKRMVSSIPRPNYADALAQARANGIEMGYYDPNGGISDAYVEKIREQIREEKEQAEREAEEAALRAEMEAQSSQDDEGDEQDAEDSFFANIADKISSPMGDEVGDRETGEFEPVRGAHAADIPAAYMDEEDEEELDLDEDFVIDEPDEGFVEQDTQEIPPVEIPPDEVLEILEPEPVKDPTGPIVMDPTEVVEAIVEEAADAVDDAVVAEVVETMASEMLEVAELDPEECKSFTDSFMAIEVGEDGKARPKKPGAPAEIEDDEEADKERAFASLYADDTPAATDVQEGTEEILDIAAKTREAIKRAMNEPK